jgi:hypothetical protein
MPITEQRLWSCYEAAAELLRDLDAVEKSGDVAAAQAYLAAMTRHIAPLRRAVEAVEQIEREDAERNDEAWRRIWPEAI